MSQKLTVSLSPHIHTRNSLDLTMWRVVLAMLPAWGVAVWTFGLPALYVSLISILTCVFVEWSINRWLFHRPETISNGSAVVTGLLLAFNLPSILPWWMVMIGAVVAIGIGKMSFGGLGCNIWNPALVGRVFLLLSFPAAMTTWPTGVDSGWKEGGTMADGWSGATMLQGLNATDNPIPLSEVNFMDMAIGNVNGSLGEVGAIAILLGLAYLLITRVVTWHIPVSVLASAAFFSWIFGGNPILDLFAGGLILGASFMATDYVTSPMTRKGQLIYGFMIGFITIIIRRFGAYPEGVSFAILLMNSLTPLINIYCRPKAFGAREAEKMRKASAN